MATIEQFRQLVGQGQTSEQAGFVKARFGGLIRIGRTITHAWHKFDSQFKLRTEEEKAEAAIQLQAEAIASVNKFSRAVSTRFSRTINYFRHPSFVVEDLVRKTHIPDVIDTIRQALPSQEVETTVLYQRPKDESLPFPLLKSLNNNRVLQVDYTSPNMAQRTQMRGVYKEMAANIDQKRADGVEHAQIYLERTILVGRNIDVSVFDVAGSGKIRERVIGNLRTYLADCKSSSQRPSLERINEISQGRLFLRAYSYQDILTSISNYDDLFNRHLLPSQMLTVLNRFLNRGVANLNDRRAIRQYLSNHSRPTLSKMRSMIAAMPAVDHRIIGIVEDNKTYVQVYQQAEVER